MAAAAATEGFAPGITSPTEILLQGRGMASRTAQVARLSALIQREPGVAGVIGDGTLPPQVTPAVFQSRDGTAARLIVILGADPLGSSGLHLLGNLEARMPTLLHQAGLSGVTAGFAGDSALAFETVRHTLDGLWAIALAALLVDLLLLAIFLRALIAPLYLLAVSALVVAAAIGLTTLVFQVWLGHPGLTYYVPFAAAVLLVALGSDYNVFVVGRIWQEGKHRPLRDAIRVAAPRASRAIGVAGLALAGSFALLALVPLVPFREFAFCMAVGVLIDSFLVRSLLVPSLMTLFGRFSHWPGMPKASLPEPTPKTPTATSVETQAIA
jgi:RND superfamily putative drug exporter